jgi:hypothetical protein
MLFFFRSNFMILVSFLSDLWWFCRHWHPIRVRWNSPKTLWCMARKRKVFKHLLCAWVRRVANRKETDNEVR